MPILHAEPDLYPDDLLEAARPAEPQRRWWAMYTLPRREKQLVRRLRELAIGHYGPLVPRRTRSPAGRVRVAHVPLFPGYVFVFGDREERYHALATNCVARDLQVPDGEALRRDLCRVRRLIETGAPLTPEDRLQPGTPVRVRSGAFHGQEGLVIKRHGETRLLVAVDFLQRGASVLLDDCQLEPIPT